MLGYELSFSHCWGQALDHEVTAACVVSVGECLRGHADERSVRNSDKFGFRSAFSFLRSLRTESKNVRLPSQVLGAWNLVRILNYDSEGCLYCCTCSKHTEVPRSCFSVLVANAQLFCVLLHLEVLVSSTYSICSISHQLRGVLDAHELGTKPSCIVLPCLSVEFRKFSPNSAAVEVSGTARAWELFECSIS